MDLDRITTDLESAQRLCGYASERLQRDDFASAISALRAVLGMADRAYIAAIEELLETDPDLLDRMRRYTDPSADVGVSGRAGVG